MTYDQWKTTDPRELLPNDEEQPSELDLVYADLHKAQGERDALAKALRNLMDCSRAIVGASMRDPNAAEAFQMHTMAMLDAREALRIKA